MRPHGRARVSATNPQAFAICQRCGFLYNHVSLKWQYEYGGAGLINLRILVCNDCYDTPQAQFKAVIVPADPVPIQFPLSQDYVDAEANYRITTGQNTIDPITGLPIPGNTIRITQNNETRTTQQTGEAPGGVNTLPGTDPNAPGDADPGLPYNNVTVPDTGPLK